MKGNVKQTPIDWLKNELTEKDYNLAKKTFLQIDESLEGIFLKNIFKEAKKREMEIMDEFSKWLADSNYKLMYNLSACWVNQKNSEIKNMSELYQMFLKSKEA